MNKVTLLFCAMMLCFSCQGPAPSVVKTKVYNESGLTCKVISPAGDVYPSFSHISVGPFFNIGRFTISEDRRVDAIILSERLKKGKKIGVDPVALFSFRRDTSYQKYVVVIPHDNGGNNLVKTYDEFLTKNMELKMAIENWFKAQCHMNECRDYTWENSFKALLELE